MGLKTNFNQAPYFNDYDPQKNFHRIVWKPEQSVQVRELNQLQSYVHEQQERFADNIFVRGTIVQGVNFNFFNPYPYVKLADFQLDGEQPTNPEEYMGALVEDEGTGLKAYVVNYADGFEASDPDLKTIYVKYINSGTSGNLNAFTPGNNITISDADKSLWRIGVDAGGVGFANSDTVIITPALLVNVSSGTFTNSDYIVDPATGANAEIIEADVDTVPGKTILKIKPIQSDLTNTSISATAWTFSLYTTVTNQTGVVSAIIEEFYGESATASLRTDAVGNIREVPVTNRGRGYTIAPHVTVKTANSSATVGSLTLEAQNFIAKVNIPSTGSSVGNGYAFGVSEGVVYDLGYFVRVEPQTVLVSKYTSEPNNTVVGFMTDEQIIDHTIDSSLLDNALGTENETAPGADRLKLVPKLTVLSKDVVATNAEFFSLVEWNDGNPVKQNQGTQYSRLGDQMAQTVYDQNGNFVLDAFQVTTASTLNPNLESHFYSVIVDPGQAYINGRKVQTLANYRIDLTKGTDTKVGNNSISLNYGNYIRVNQVGGSLDTSYGANVYFYTLPKKFLSNTAAYGAGNTSPLGINIGSARIRSAEIESGKPGQADAVYRMYVFDVKMNAGRNFEDARSVFLDDPTYDAIADIVTQYNGNTAGNTAVLLEKGTNGLIFPAGCESLKNSNTTTYEYRATSTVNTTIATGIVSVSTSAGDEYFPYGVTRSLTLSEMQDLIVVPAEDDLVVDAAITGTVAVNTTSNTVTGTSTNFFDNFQPGDFVFMTDGSLDSIRQVTSVSGTTVMKIDAAPSFANASATIRRAFPKGASIPFGYRDGLTANVDNAGQTVTLKFGHSNGAAMAFSFGSAQLKTKVTYNVQRRDVASSLKTTQRGKYVKIRLSNAAGKITGPWCIGVPDAARLRAVYVGNSSVSTTSSDVTSNFYIDHNQNANYLGLGYLYLSPQTSFRPTASQYLLVCFDYFENDDVGYYDTRSYLRTADAATIAVQDSKTFTQLNGSTAASSWEVPQVFTVDNKYFDLLNCFDFRPACEKTATPSDTPAGAPINPAETISFSSLIKFPKPNGVMTTTMEQYLGRIDDIYIGESGNIYVLKGIADVNPRRRLQSNHPKDSVRLQMLNVPPYPNLTAAITPTVKTVMNTRVYNERTSGVRLKGRAIEPVISTTNLQTSQPMVYTMEDIANLERRIKDLEYITGLTLLETSITNKTIPSSVDRSLNRFKFGFIADDFSTDIYSDISNPQYAASFESEGDLNWGVSGNPMEEDRASIDKSNPLSTTIAQPTKIIQKETNRITPLKFNWSMRHLSENMFFVDEVILTQNNCTVAPPPPDKPKPDDPKPDPCVVVVSNTAALNSGFAYTMTANKRVSAFYTEPVAGTTTIYFQAYGKVGTDVGTKFEVYNANNVLVASTSATRNDISVIPAADKTFLASNALAKTFDGAIQKVTYTDYKRNTNADLRDYVIGAGKFSFNNGNGGKFTIKAESLSNAPNFKFLIKYPSYYSVNSLVVNKANCNPTNPPTYTGTLSAGSLTLLQWSCSNQFRVNSTNYRAFVLEGSGLKPNTVHKLYMDSVIWPHCMDLTQSLLDQAKYADVLRKSKNYTGLVNVGTINTQTLLVSRQFAINELTRFLSIARAKLYDASGNPTATSGNLKTNASGKLRVLVFFPLDVAGWFSQDFNATAYGETKTGTSTNPYEIAYSSGKLKPTQGSSGYSSIQVTNGTDSRAVRVFANRTPMKTLPSDPKGSI